MKVYSLNMRGWGGVGKRNRIKHRLSSGSFDMCMFQETKRNGISKKMVASVWGRGEFEYVSKDANGQSGGLLCIWGHGLFDVMSTVIGEHFICISAKFHDSLCHFVNVYSACTLTEKRRLWDDLRKLKDEVEVGHWCMVGDFNAVVHRNERRGVSTGSYSAERREFLAFIEDMELVDVPVLGKKFTYFASDGVTMSRLDRFLISEDFISRWRITAQWVGDRDVSDHCPIWLISSKANWGPKPFRFNNCWLEHKDFHKEVKECWESNHMQGRHSFILKRETEEAERASKEVK